MKPRTVLLACAAGALIGTGTGWYNAATVSALPQCGGNQHQWQAPVTCQASRVIDGTLITETITVTASGDTTAVFQLATPRPTDTLIHITSHEGISNSGGADLDPIGIIPAGQTVGTLHIAHALCGQLDSRAVKDSKAGRVNGAWFNNDTCTVAPSTTTTTPTTSPSSSPTSPPTTGPRSSSTTTPGTAQNVPGTSAHPGNLPATGSNAEGPVLMYGLGGLVVGGGLIVATRRRAS